MAESLQPEVEGFGCWGEKRGAAKNKQTLLFDQYQLPPKNQPLHKVLFKDKLVLRRGTGNKVFGKLLQGQLPDTLSSGAFLAFYL